MQAIFEWKKFLYGIAKSAILTLLPYTRFPFAPPEKALSADWNSIGKDIRSAVEKFNKRDEA